MSIYDTLNKEQKEACFHTEGPVLILAGAGSGKTRVITHRIAYLMEECGVNPWNILAITFTNKAAGEMREREDKLIGFGAESVWISTFHSMCVRILRRHIDLIGYTNNFNIYDADDQKTLVKQILRQMNIDDKQVKPRSVIAAISTAKSELKTPQNYMDDLASDYSHTFIDEKIGEIYAEYEKQLRANNALDFDDLLMKTVELFNAHEEVLANYQERFHYIMVDEYQDTNKAQFEIVKRLAAKYRNLCVVGDDDQSIYKFRGADIRNILDFEKVYKDAFVVRLEQNYRSTQNVLDAANAVIAHNTNRKEKRLWTDHGAGAKIHFREFADGRDEASFIAEDILRQMSEDRKLSYKDFAVLYRTNAQSRQIEDEFVLQSIPYNIVGGHNFYDRMEVRDILGYLRTINNAQDDISTQRIINVPKRGIGRTTIDKVEAEAQKEGISFFEVLEKLDRIPDLSRARTKVQPFVKLILDCRAYAKNHTVDELIKKVVEDTGYEEYLKDYDEETADDRIQNVDELISKAASYEQDLAESEGMDESLGDYGTGMDAGSTDQSESAAGSSAGSRSVVDGSSGEVFTAVDGAASPRLSGFLENVSLVAEIDQVGESDDRVLLMTLHSAKGLEFPHVYLAGMEENIFPSFQAVQKADAGDNEGIEEERRLAYVGITRAKDDLTLTAARGRMIRGDMQYNPVSRFVMEIPEELLDESPRRVSHRLVHSYDDYDDGYDDSGSSSGDDYSFGSDSDMPWSDDYERSSLRRSGRGASYGTGRYGNRGSDVTRDGFSQSRYAVGNSAFGAKSGFSGNRSAGSANRMAGNAGRTVGNNTTPKAGGRLKARYSAPHTAAEKKPYLSGKSGLDALGSLNKGMPAGTKPDYEVGDRVEHVKYGQGTVESIEKGPKDYKVKVLFDDAGQKIMYAAFAKLKKIS